MKPLFSSTLFIPFAALIALDLTSVSVLLFRVSHTRECRKIEEVNVQHYSILEQECCDFTGSCEANYTLHTKNRMVSGHGNRIDSCWYVFQVEDAEILISSCDGTIIRR